jgi:hypothetical protein
MHSAFIHHPQYTQGCAGCMQLRQLGQQIFLLARCRRPVAGSERVRACPKAVPRQFQASSPVVYRLPARCLTFDPPRTHLEHLPSRLGCCARPLRTPQSSTSRMRILREARARCAKGGRQHPVALLKRQSLSETVNCPLLPRKQHAANRTQPPIAHPPPTPPSPSAL